MADYIMAYRFDPRSLLYMFPLSSTFMWLRKAMQLSGMIGNKDSVDDPFQLLKGSVGVNVGSAAGNYLNKVSGSGLTDADIQASDLQLQNERALRQSYYQDATKSMQDAGLNTALMYGSGAGSASGGAQSVSPSSAALSDIIQLVTLPAQLKVLKAQAKNIDAQTRNTDQKTLTEEQLTILQKIRADYGIELTEKELAQMDSVIANNIADTKFKQRQESYIESQEDAQRITNRFLPRKLQNEISQLAASSKSLSAQASQALAQAAFTTVQYEYARDNKVLMSSNDMATIATYLCDLLGVGSPKDVVEVVEKGIENVKEDFKAPFMRKNPEYWLERYLEQYGNKD